MARLHDVEVDAFLYQSVHVDPLDVNDEFVKLPSTLAYWAHRYTVTLQAHLTAKLTAERVRARLSLTYRERRIAGNQKVTEGVVDALISQDAEYVKACEAEITAEVDRVAAKGTLDAVYAKKDMLVSLGANIRAQMERDPVIKSRIGGGGSL